MFHKIRIALFMLIFGGSIVAQPPPSAPSSAPKPSTEKAKPFSWGSIKSLPASPQFVSLDGLFSIGLSQQIQGFAGRSPKDLKVNASGSEFTWKYDEGEIVVMFLNYSKNEYQGAEAELKRLAENLNSFIQKNRPQAKKVDELYHKDSEIFISKLTYQLSENEFLIQRLYAVENRVYRLFSVFKGSKNAKFLNEAFDTFKFISQKEVDAELAKKYESMKPSPLPQSPVVAKQKSDAEDEGFKGKVKKVIRESEDLSGTWSVQGRKMSWVTYINEQGNRIQQDFYDFKGLPSSISVYGFIDSKRVSNDKSARYDDNPPIMAPAPLSAKKEETLKPDNRYQMSYEYKYLDGKVIEKVFRFNTGKFWMRYEYKYSKNKVEELVYSNDGKINQHYVSTLDDSGNEIEQTNLDVLKIYGEKKYRYEYEFDAQGNWTKQTTYKEEISSGVSSFKPYSVHHRTISYW